jgi:hypothetical protein
LRAGEVTGQPDDQKRRLGQTIAEVLEPMEPRDRLPFLAYAEQRARAEGDLEALRAIKDYREMSRSLQTSTKPPETD